MLFQGEILDEVAHERAQHDMFLQSQLATFTGRKNQVKQCLEAVKKAETGIIMVTGKQGCGKTAILVRYDEIDRRDETQRGEKSRWGLWKKLFYP